MKIKETFLIHETDTETMLIPTGKAEFSGIVRGNSTLGAILNLLKEETTEKALLDGMKKAFPDAPEAALERDIEKAVRELRRIGALDD